MFMGLWVRSRDCQNVTARQEVGVQSRGECRAGFRAPCVFNSQGHYLSALQLASACLSGDATRDAIAPLATKIAMSFPSGRATRNVIACSATQLACHYLSRAAARNVITYLAIPRALSLVI
jgi:hypothetical protein